MFSSFLRAKPRASYVHYISVEKEKMKGSGEVSILGKLSKNAPAVISFGITDLDKTILYIVSEKNIFVKIQTEDSFVMNIYKPALFRASFLQSCQNPLGWTSRLSLRLRSG